MKAEQYELDLPEVIRGYWRRNDQEPSNFSYDKAMFSLVSTNGQIDHIIGRLAEKGANIFQCLSATTTPIALRNYAVLINLSLLGLKRMEEIETENEKYSIPPIDFNLDGDRPFGGFLAP